MDIYNSSFEKIKGLAEDFKNGFAQFTSPEYSEARVRQDFIDKFFDALGWDVYHNIQKNPYYQEVKIERPQKQQQSKAQKRADYSFCLAPDFKHPKFFVEAKKPARDLRSADDYFQTIKYGWNAGTGISVLTDFEEFHIIDCRFEPDINQVFNAKHEKIHFSEYKNDDVFSKIYWLFSREAVEAGNIEKYVSDLPIPKGGAKQATLFGGRYRSIDDSFLQYIDDIREKLAKAFKKNDESLNSEMLTEAVQRTIDRLVFIRFLEDKLIEQDNYVSEFGKRTTGWKDFITICRKLNVKYNGVVFEKHFIDETEFTKDADKIFWNICQGFSHINTPYDFNYIPIHILGSIYERFLGKIVVATSKRVEIENKPEVSKANGVYYTPKFVVDYIITNTIEKQISDKTPTEISKMAFADIACGSGSFLIGVFGKLLDYHTKYYNDNPEEAKKAKCHKIDGVFALTIKQKQQILLNNIYGIDLDHQATEVTQLSLYLKMLEDETTATANDMMVLFHEKILPDLSSNIKHGNSLIGTEIFIGKMFDFEEEKKIYPFDFETAFPRIFRRGGFDVIVGNPPYVKEYTNRKTFEQVRLGKLNKYYKGKMDLWYFFVCYGLDLLKSNGKLGFIVPNNWVSNAGASILRTKVITDSKIENMVDFDDYMVFKNASIQTMILLIEKNSKDDGYILELQKFTGKKLYQAQVINDLTIDHGEPKVSEISTPLIEREKYKNGFLKFDSNIDESILDKIQAAKNFELNGKKEVAQGIVAPQDNLNKKGAKKLKFTMPVGTGIFNLTEKEKESLFLMPDELELIKPFYSTDELGRYYGKKENGLWVIYTNSSFKKPINIKPYPNIKKHLDQFKSVITSHFAPYGLHRSRIEGFFKGEKIIALRKCENPTFTYTDFDCYVSQTFNIIKSKRIDLKYLTAILNSSLIKYWLVNKGKMQGSLFQIDKEPLLKIPIYNTKDKKLKANIIRLVEQLLSAHAQLPTMLSSADKEYYRRKIEALDKQLDNSIFQLYNISGDEIEIIENRLFKKADDKYGNLVPNSQLGLTCI